jgi:hypothetical protein
MKVSQWFRVLLLHEFLALFVAIPVGLAVFYALQLVRGQLNGSGLLDLTVLFPGVAIPTLIGAVFYTAVIEAIARKQTISTASSVAYAPLLLVPWLAFPIRGALLFPPFAIGLAVGLILFGILAARLRIVVKAVPAAA